MSASEAYSIAANLMLKSDIPEGLVPIIEAMERLERVLNTSREELDRLASGYEAMAAAALRSIDQTTRATTEGAEAGARAQTEAADQGARAQVEASERSARAAEQSARIATEAHSQGMQRRYDASYAAAHRENTMRDGMAAEQQARDIRASRSEAEYMNRDRDLVARRAAGSHVSSMDVVMAAGATEAATAGVIHSIAHASLEPAQYEYLLTTDDRISKARAHEASEAAFDATTYAPGSTHGGNMESMYDIQKIVQDIDESQAALPQFARLGQVMRAASMHATGTDNPAFAASKSLELLGRMTSDSPTEIDPNTGMAKRIVDVKQLTKYTEALARIDVATGGSVDPAMYLGYAKQGRVGAMQADDRFTFHQLPAILQVLGGQRTGTALNSANQVFEGGHAQQKTIQAMIDNGLADKGALYLTQNRLTGKKEVAVDYSKIHNKDLLTHNFVEYVRKSTDQMAVAMAAQGKTPDQIKEAILSVLQQIGQRSTIGGAMADVYMNQANIDKEEKHIDHTLVASADNPDPMGKYLKENPMARVQQFQSSFERLMAALGGPAVGPALAIMDGVTATMNKLGDWAKEHPYLSTAIDSIVGIAAVIAGAAAAISGTMLLYGPLIAMAKARYLSGSGPGAVIDAAAAAGGGAASAGLLGTIVGIGKRALLPLAGGWMAHQMDSDDTSGKFMDKYIPGAAALDNFAYQHSGGYVGRPYESAAPPPTPLPPPVDKNTPQAVRVTNPGDLANANIANMVRQANKPDNGVSGFDAKGSVQSHPNVGMQ